MDVWSSGMLPAVCRLGRAHHQLQAGGGTGDEAEGRRTEVSWGERSWQLPVASSLQAFSADTLAGPWKRRSPHLEHTSPACLAHWLLSGHCDRSQFICIFWIQKSDLMLWNLAEMVTVPGRALCCLSLRATGFIFSFLFLSFLKGKHLSSLALFRAVSILSEEGKWPLT